MSGLVDIWVHTWLYPQVAFIGMHWLPWFVLEADMAPTLEIGLQNLLAGQWELEVKSSKYSL